MSGISRADADEIKRLINRVAFAHFTDRDDLRKAARAFVDSLTVEPPPPAETRMKTVECRGCGTSFEEPYDDEGGVWVNRCGRNGCTWPVPMKAEDFAARFCSGGTPTNRKEAMSRTWFTADLHLGHRLVSELRGFATIDEHDQAIFDRWEATIGRDDVVWILGDITLHQPDQPLLELRGLPGRKRLIAGNHDGCHPMHSRAYRATLKYQEAFEYIAASASVKVGGVRTLLSHFPYLGGGDRGDGFERYTQWRLPDEGMPLLHGHTHSKERGTDRIVNVGLDAWAMTPVPAESLDLARSLAQSGEKQ